MIFGSVAISYFSKGTRSFRAASRHGLGVLRIGAAPAQVTCQLFPDLFFRGVDIPVEESLGRYHEARRAVAALHAVVLHVFFDEGVVLSGDAFHRLYSLAVALNGEGHAGEDRPAVHDHRAGAAGAPVAHLFCAGEAQPVMDKIVEGPLGLNLLFIHLAVDGEGDGARRLGYGLAAVLGEQVLAYRLICVETG